MAARGTTWAPLLVALACVLLQARSAQAQFFKPSAVKFQALNLPSPQHIPPTDSCVGNTSYPGGNGTCFPAKFSMANNTLYYWCGFYATHKTVWSWNVTNVNNTNTVATTFIRNDALFDCVIPNLQKNNTAAASNCIRVQYADCSSTLSCSVRVQGFAYPADMCFVLYNRKNATIKGQVSLQIFNFFNQYRLVGTVWAVIYVVITCLAVLATLGYKYYTEWVNPSFGDGSTRHLENLRKPLTDLELEDHYKDVNLDDHVPEPRTKVQLADRFSSGWNKVKHGVVTLNSKAPWSRKDDPLTNGGHQA